MLNPEEFRTGQFGLPFAEAEKLLKCCRRCVYLRLEESPVCFCDAPFYYYCGYSWPEKLTAVVPPCLK
jgi:hypothetical protein